MVGLEKTEDQKGSEKAYMGRSTGRQPVFEPTKYTDKETKWRKMTLHA